MPEVDLAQGYERLRSLIVCEDTSLSPEEITRLKANFRKEYIRDHSFREYTWIIGAVLCDTKDLKNMDLRLAEIVYDR